MSKETGNVPRKIPLGSSVFKLVDCAGKPARTLLAAARFKILNWSAPLSIKSTRLVGVFTPCWYVKSNLGLPFAPFFVVIKITPLAAREPNKIEAEASFSTSIDSMSSGFISESGFMAIPPAPKAELLTGWPSITMSGWALELMEATPRTLIRTAPPGVPPACVICTPAARPCKATSGLAAVLARMSADLSETIEPVTSRLRCSPKATICTSCKVLLSGVRLTLMVFWLPTRTSRASKPT